MKKIIIINALVLTFIAGNVFSSEPASTPKIAQVTPESLGIRASKEPGNSVFSNRDEAEEHGLLFSKNNNFVSGELVVVPDTYKGNWVFGIVKDRIGQVELWNVQQSAYSSAYQPVDTFDIGKFPQASSNTSPKPKPIQQAYSQAAAAQKMNQSCSSSSTSSKPLTYSDHAKDRMKERNRSVKEAQTAVQSGMIYLSKHDDGSLVHIDATSGTRVIVDPKKNKAVTVTAMKPKFQSSWNPRGDANDKQDTRNQWNSKEKK